MFIIHVWPAGMVKFDHVTVCPTTDVGVKDDDTYVNCDGNVSTTAPVAVAVQVFSSNNW